MGNDLFNSGHGKYCFHVLIPVNKWKKYGIIERYEEFEGTESDGKKFIGQVEQESN